MSLEITTCPSRNILHPSTLLDFKYEIGPYYGCEHNCRYCYGHDSRETDWSTEIQIHENFSAQLQSELASLEKQTFFVGMDTDPYQPVEKTLQHTRQTLELLCVKGHSACILTKSDLVIRDIDLLRAMPGSSVGFSFAFQTERSRTIFEEKAPSNRRRIEAMKKLKEAGIEIYALISPVIPFITNIEMQINMLERMVDSIWVYRLKMSDENARSWLNVEEIINKHCPEIHKSFKKIVFADKHPYWENLTARLSRIQAEKRLKLFLHLQ
ncbi:MAG: hypothetical protein CVT49_15355 [candidate division Zixibacteria bacterium HGW-Zixibacteria-1]|nr:MAG: hypothetical protein CVT49_15355 [candidate division Zixibacteria bacterium HGW-Zixibacteria-1]